MNFPNKIIIFFPNFIYKKMFWLAIIIICLCGYYYYEYIHKQNATAVTNDTVTNDTVTNDTVTTNDIPIVNTTAQPTNNTILTAFTAPVTSAVSTLSLDGSDLSNETIDRLVYNMLEETSPPEYLTAVPEPDNSVELFDADANYMHSRERKGCSHGHYNNNSREHTMRHTDICIITHEDLDTRKLSAGKHMRNNLHDGSIMRLLYGETMGLTNSPPNKDDCLYINSSGLLYKEPCSDDF